VAWVLKFMILLATSGEPGGAEVLTGALLPSTGSILGLIAAFGLAAPLVADGRWSRPCWPRLWWVSSRS
jgi:hypothetical protein